MSGSEERARETRGSKDRNRALARLLHPSQTDHIVIFRSLSDGGIEMFRPNKVNIERYRYRGTKIPTPWTSTSTTGSPEPAP